MKNIKEKIEFSTTTKISIFCLFLAIVIFMISISLAAYTNQGYKKGVAATVQQNNRFSSNILNEYTSISEVKDRQGRIYSLNCAKDDNDGMIDITVCNYPQAINTQHNASDISYNIIVTVHPRNETGKSQTGYTLNNEQFTGSKTLTGFLNGSTSSMNTYTLIIPSSAINNDYISISVEPSDAISRLACSNMILYREIYPVTVESQNDESFDWIGEFTDKTEDNSSTDFHAFNYHIYGTAGNGKATLTWNSNYLELDSDDLKMFTNQPIIADVDGYKTVEFTVNSDVRQGYEILFYRTNENIDNESWSNLTVTCTFEEEETS